MNSLLFRFHYMSLSSQLRVGRLVVFQLFALLWTFSPVSGAEAVEEVELAYQSLGRALKDGQIGRAHV